MTTLVANCTIRNVRKDGVIVSGERNGVTRLRDLRHRRDGRLPLRRRPAQTDRRRELRAELPDSQLRPLGADLRPGHPDSTASATSPPNNLLYDGPHSAILFGGNEHRIELNEIHDVCYEVDDAGSIYCGRDWGLHGNIIRHNFFHHIKSSLPGSNGVHAVYLDDCASGITVFGNTFYEISGRAIMCGGGRDNTIENNVIAKCGSAHFTDRRGKVWIDKDESWKLLDKIKTVQLHRAALEHALPAAGPHSRQRLRAGQGARGLRHPRATSAGRTNAGSEKNSLGGSGGFDFYTFENNIEDQDPHFVDEQNLNLALRGRLPRLLAAGLPADSLRGHRAAGQCGTIRTSGRWPSGPASWAIRTSWCRARF